MKEVEPVIFLPLEVPVGELSVSRSGRIRRKVVPLEAAHGGGFLAANKNPNANELESIFKKK